MGYARLLIAAAVALAGCASTPPPKPDEDVSRQKAEAYIRDQLFDDEAARFKEWTPLFFAPVYVAGQIAAMPAWSICSKVNGKNRYGGYVGYQTYRVVFAGSEPTRLLIGDKVCSEAPAVEFEG